jgi:hypothetical protein
MAAPQQKELWRRFVNWFINPGQRRFTIWLITASLLITLDVYLFIYKMFWPSTYIGFLGIEITILFFLYEKFMAIPILRIEVPREDVTRKPRFIRVSLPQACRCPAQQQQVSQEVGYLRLRVRNTGLAAAEKCAFQVRIARWPSNCPTNCHAPSDEYVDWQDVTWAGWKPSVLIRPNDVRYVNIIMMPLQSGKACFSITQWNLENQCGSRCGPIIAWITKREVFDPKLGCAAKHQDGLVAGEYVVDVQVTCRNGQAVLRGLRLRIDPDWDNTDITTA